MKNLTKQLSRKHLELMITTDHAQCGDVAALARIALALQDAPGKIYQIRKLDGSEAWAEWLEVAEAEYYAPVSNDGWERRILYTASVASVPDGWKLVPLIAFPSQWAAGHKAFNTAGVNKVDAVYNAMVLAAPALGGDDA